MSGFLVFFVVDPVDDDLAAEIRHRMRALAAAHLWEQHAPGFFDDPDPGEGVRTTGGYLRLDRPAPGDALAVLEAAGALSAEHDVTIEIQWQERILGHVRGGVADEGLLEAVRVATTRR